MRLRQPPHLLIFKRYNRFVLKVPPMRNRLATIIPVLLIASISFAGKKKEPDPVFADVTARGRALYEYDQAAWHASDALQATNPPKGSLGRYIAHKSDAGWTVGFGHLSDQRDKF